MQICVTEVRDVHLLGNKGWAFHPYRDRNHRAYSLNLLALLIILKRKNFAFPVYIIYLGDSALS